MQNKGALAGIAAIHLALQRFCINQCGCFRDELYYRVSRCAPMSVGAAAAETSPFAAPERWRRPLRAFAAVP